MNSFLNLLAVRSKNVLFLLALTLVLLAPKSPVLKVVGTLYHYLVEMNSFNHFVLSHNGEQKYSFSTCTCTSVLLVLMPVFCLHSCLCLYSHYCYRHSSHQHPSYQPVPKSPAPKVVETLYHYLAEMNSFNLFAPSYSGEQNVLCLLMLLLTLVFCLCLHSH